MQHQELTCQARLYNGLTCGRPATGTNDADQPTCDAHSSDFIPVRIGSGSKVHLALRGSRCVICNSTGFANVRPVPDLTPVTCQNCKPAEDQVRKPEPAAKEEPISESQSSKPSRRERSSAMKAQKQQSVKKVASDGQKECKGVPRLSIKAHVANVSEFGRDSSAKDGLYRICKVCDHEYQKAWREAKAKAEGVDPQPAADKKAAATSAKRATGTTKRTRSRGAGAATTRKSTRRAETPASAPATSVTAPSPEATELQELDRKADERRRKDRERKAAARAKAREAKAAAASVAA